MKLAKTAMGISLLKKGFNLGAIKYSKVEFRNAENQLIGRKSYFFAGIKDMGVKILKKTNRNDCFERERTVVDLRDLYYSKTEKASDNKSSLLVQLYSFMDCKGPQTFRLALRDGSKNNFFSKENLKRLHLANIRYWR